MCATVQFGDLTVLDNILKSLRFSHASRTSTLVTNFVAAIKREACASRVGPFAYARAPPSRTSTSGPSDEHSEHYDFLRILTPLTKDSAHGNQHVHKCDVRYYTGICQHFSKSC